MATSILTCVEDICECPICSSVMIQPKCLPCLHTFCLACIRQHCKNAEPKKKSTFCPVCRSEFTFTNDCENLKTNFHIEKLCQAKRSDKIDPKTKAPKKSDEMKQKHPTPIKRLPFPNSLELLKETRLTRMNPKYLTMMEDIIYVVAFHNDAGRQKIYSYEFDGIDSFTNCQSNHLPNGLRVSGIASVEDCNFIFITDVENTRMLKCVFGAKKLTVEEECYFSCSAYDNNDEDYVKLALCRNKMIVAINFSFFQEVDTDLNHLRSIEISNLNTDFYRGRLSLLFFTEIFETNSILLDFNSTIKKIPKSKQAILNCGNRNKSININIINSITYQCTTNAIKSGKRFYLFDDGNTIYFTYSLLSDEHYVLIDIDYGDRCFYFSKKDDILIIGKDEKMYIYKVNYRFLSVQ